MAQLETKIDQFPTYNSKQDPSNSDPHFLAKGSLNMLINDLEKVKTREGFTLQSLAGVNQRVVGSFEWEDSTGGELPLKAYMLADNSSGNLDVFINGNWENLMSGLTSVKLIFEPYWDTTQKIDQLLWCDGSANIYNWSGAVATLASINSNSVTCQGTDTFAKQRFLLSVTRAIRIKDDNGVWHRSVYTGGESTTTLTGLSDLTAFPFSGGNLIVQEVITNSNQPASGFNVDFLRVIENQVWAGSRSSNQVYVSKNTSITDYTFSTPRAVGEGALLTLDGPGRAIGVLRSDVILHAGINFIYKSTFNQITVGASLAETLSVVRLKSTSRQAALHQNLLEEIDNGLVWIGADNVLYEMIDATLAYNPKILNISDPIKPDFDATDFMTIVGHLKFINNRIYISAPSSAVNFIREFRLDNKNNQVWFWQPPQTYPVARYAIIKGQTCGHSSATNETYNLFTGTNDNGQAIHNVLTFMRWNGGVRELLKNGDEFFTEGYITGNTKLGETYVFDEDGGEFNMLQKIIDGSYSQILYPTALDISLGNLPLGDDSLSGDVTGASPFVHFRVIDDLNEEEFFDYTVKYETNDKDYQWQIMCYGNNSSLSTGKPTGIKNKI